MSSNPPPIADPEDLLGTYAFLPWLRQGLANAITAPPAAGTRASVHVEVDIDGTPINGGAPLTQSTTQDIALYGPGEILGIEQRAVIRTEPRAGVANFESNYLPAIDFYDEDFPWRYTPAPPTGLKLTPWIALIVLKQSEFTEGKNIANRPLPFITLTNLSSLPNADELWAWAHVHFNQGLSPNPSTELVSTDMSAVLPRVQTVLDTNPDLAYSRLLCPRLLDVDTGYDAFVFPAFETGRLAGLGHDPTKSPSALASAWARYANQQEPANFPYYYRWQFTTGDRGDFRYLVSLLKAQPVDPTVGTRDFDAQDPGSNLPGVNKPELKGILRLGGALEVPDTDLTRSEKATRDAYEKWDDPYPDSFEESLAKFINLPDDYAAKTPAAANAASSITPSSAGISQPVIPDITSDPDPLITSPLYGRWHALTERVLFNRDGTTAPNSTNWVHRLNLDPRFRIPANYGVEVVEGNAEEYMNYAWLQIGDVLQANQNIRRLHFATAASVRLYARHMIPASSDPARVLSLTAPVSSRILFSGTTVASLRASTGAPTLVPPVLTSTVFRRILRPGGRLMRSLPFTATATRSNLIQRINGGQVSAAPPKTVPRGAVTVNQIANAVLPAGAPNAVLGWLKKFPWLPWVLLGVAVLLAILSFFVLGPIAGAVAALAILGGGIFLFRLLRGWSNQEQAFQTVSETGQTPASVASYPTSSNFVLSTPGSSFVPTLGGADSPTGVRFNTALEQSFRLNEAANSAAAVLRAGFTAAQADGTNSGALSVNLSSDRVRVALSLIEGIRNGQSLGALLGYQFELGLHDQHGLTEVDKFVYPLRKQFPLVADALASTKTGPDIPIEAIEARNVLDGKKLVDQITKSNTTTYPWGVSGLPSATANEQAALDAQADALRNAYDAIADLALAEGVYQAVQGNYDRVASTIAAYTTGNFPPEPGVVDTAPTGVGLTHRFAIQFRSGLAAPGGATPRAQAEPALDDWLKNMLPPLDQIACTVTWTNPVTLSNEQHVIKLKDLKLRPIDALYLLKPDNVQAMAEIDDRIQRHVASTWNPRPDAVVKIQYMTAPPGSFSVFESAPLLRSLRSLLAQSRPLRATDILRANDASQKDNSTVSVDQTRLTSPLGNLSTLIGELDAFVNTTLAPLLLDTTANRGPIIANVDTFLTSAVTLLERAARLALPSSGWGFLYDWLHLAFADLLAQVGDLVTRWTHKLTDFANALDAYDLLPGGTSDADRFAALQAAELIVSTKLDPPPATPALLRVALPAKGTALKNRLAQFQTIQASAGTTFASLFSATTALSTAEFDTEPFDVSKFGDRAITITQDISRALSSQLAVAKKRVADVNGHLTDASSATSAADQVAALTAAAKALLGDDFHIIPEFTVSTAQGAEWANAVNASTSGDLFTYLKTTLKMDFPVDEWFYGAARVRQPLRHWESAVMLASAFGLTPPPLTAIQLPFSAGEPWRALEYPEKPPLTSDRLLYTCLYSELFNPAARQCGVLVDEWTETIPAATRDTAITFNYDRPDNEPPQTLLLVASASATGAWQWADLVGALNETLDLAKKRAVEPAFLDTTVYSRFLPATVTASTSYGITIATPLTAANGVMAVLRGGPDA